MKAYRKREDGVVAVDLKLNPRTGNYLNKLGDLFCCSNGIYNETQEWHGGNYRHKMNVDGVTDHKITFVISKLKPRDGICKKIWRDELSDVSLSAEEAYMAAAGNKQQAWYWIEH